MYYSTMNVLKLVRSRLKMGSVRPIFIMLTCAIILFVIEWYLYNHDYNKGISLSAGKVDMVGADRQYPGSAVVMFQMELVTLHHLHYDASDEAIHKREQEYMKALQRNLNHELVKSIHVLTADAKEFMQQIENLELSNQSKLLTVELNVNLYRDIFEYISQNLVGIDVMW